LDYTHRNEDGSVGNVPDSLISEYETRNGRLVYDGGGVQPDIEVIPESLSEIALRLYTESIYFDYATLFRNFKDSIGPAGNFSLSHLEYEDFKEFVKEKDFEYETASVRAFNRLVTIAKNEKYYDLSEEEFRLLEEKLSHNIEKDLETFREEIVQILEEEIVGRYYYHAGRIEHQIRDDEQLTKAVSVISNLPEVLSILNGSTGALARH
jgi:carboxyl-terminal processing protease